MPNPTAVPAEDLDAAQLERVAAGLSDADVHRIRQALNEGDLLELGRIFAGQINAVVTADGRIEALRQRALAAGSVA